jgi:hypothetical protein
MRLRALREAISTSRMRMMSADVGQWGQKARPDPDVATPTSLASGESDVDQVFPFVMIGPPATSRSSSALKTCIAGDAISDAGAFSEVAVLTATARNRF